MIGIIRVRLDTEPNATVWTDAQWRTLMDPNVQFSLANFWRTCSFGLADLSYSLFPVVTVTDPSKTMTPEQIEQDPGGRSTRVKAITDAIDAQYSPNWSQFNTLLIWIASKMDLFGGAMDHGHGTCGVMMCDINSKFDQMCHELGHTLGFDHPFLHAKETPRDTGLAGLEYLSPYDIMGGYDSEWTRPAVSGLPVNGAGGADLLALAGPMLSAAQLSTSVYRPALAPLFNQMSSDFQWAPQTVEIAALDAAASAWPGFTRPMAAVLPADPISPDFHYVIELRRSGGYDAGLDAISSDPYNGVAAVVVHGFNALTRRWIYAGRIPLTSTLGDTDLHAFRGSAGSDITVRLLEVGPNDEWARVRVGGPNFWRNFGVDVEIRDTIGETVYSAWSAINVQPCVFAPVGQHQFRYRSNTTAFDIDASSFGYERPGLIWRLNGVELTPNRGAAFLDVSCSSPDPINGWQPRSHRLTFDYNLLGAHLRIEPPVGVPVGHRGPGRDRRSARPELGNFLITLEVSVDETSPGAMKNAYPQRSVTTVLRYDGVGIEWDQAYEDDRAHCEEVRQQVDSKRIPVPGPRRPGDQMDDGLPNILDVIATMIDTNPAAANVLVERVAHVANLSNLEILTRLHGRG